MPDTKKLHIPQKAIEALLKQTSYSYKGFTVDKLNDVSNLSLNGMPIAHSRYGIVTFYNNIKS